jgi:hypothetical protein
MNAKHSETRIENGVTLIFRGTFLNLPIYSPETISVDATTPDSTAVVRHEELAESFREAEQRR